MIQINRKEPIMRRKGPETCFCRCPTRAHAESLRRKAVRRVREEYGGAVGGRFGQTLAAVVRHKVCKGVKKERAAKNY